MYVEQQAGVVSFLHLDPPQSPASFPPLYLSLSRFSSCSSSEATRERRERVPVSQYLDRRSRTCPYSEIRSTRDHSGPPEHTGPYPAHLWKIDRDILSRERTRAHTGCFVSRRSVLGVLAIEFASAKISSEP